MKVWLSYDEGCCIVRLIGGGVIVFFGSFF